MHNILQGFRLEHSEQLAYRNIIPRASRRVVTTATYSDNGTERCVGRAANFYDSSFPVTSPYIRRYREVANMLRGLGSWRQVTELSRGNCSRGIRPYSSRRNHILSLTNGHQQLKRFGGDGLGPRCGLERSSDDDRLEYWWW